jgi:hypothetical protein
MDECAMANECPRQAAGQSLESLDKDHMICYPLMPVTDDLVPTIIRFKELRNCLRPEVPYQRLLKEDSSSPLTKGVKTNEAFQN